MYKVVRYVGKYFMGVESEHETEQEAKDAKSKLKPRGAQHFIVCEYPQINYDDIKMEIETAMIEIRQCVHDSPTQYSTPALKCLEKFVAEKNKPQPVRYSSSDTCPQAYMCDIRARYVNGPKYGGG